MLLILELLHFAVEKIIIKTDHQHHLKMGTGGVAKAKKQTAVIFFLAHFMWQRGDQHLAN